VKHILMIFGLLTGLLQSQETTKTPAVQVLSRIGQDKILLRWAVDEPIAWKAANTYGFLIERSTLSRNGKAVIPIEKQMLTATPLKPKALVEWEAIASQDQNAAILAQALYGERFETTAPNNTLGAIYAINDALEQRFTFALLAAEQNYEAAKLAGWAFEDTTAIRGENYLYAIHVAIPDGIYNPIESGTIFASTDRYEELPQPIGFMGVFEDSRVALNWNFHLLKHAYTHYLIERSENNQDFKQLNGVPIFSVQESNTPMGTSLSYTDSIPNNKTFYYRIKGKTVFGETGPASEIVSGHAMQSLGFSPRIFQKEVPTDTRAILHWEFDKKGNELITGFEVRRASNDKGPFKTMKKNIPPTERKVTVTGLQSVNYFKIVALGKNGIEHESYPTLVQPIDTTPPLPPTGLEAVMDTTGILKISWNKNSEDDLKGYRLFKATNPDVEFNEITKTTLLGEVFIDTIPIKDLNEKIYYKLKAEDQRYNQSVFSELLLVDKPDLIPPSPPVFKNYQVTAEGVEINWIPSSSDDVIAHSLYRKQNTHEQWEPIFESQTPTDSLYLDTSIALAGLYSYTMTAKDKTGLESTPTDVLSIQWNGKEIMEDDIKFTGTVNRELRFIQLTWKIKSTAILEYRLYRGTKENDLKWYKTLDATAKGFTDVALEINSRYYYGLQLVLTAGRTSLIKELNLKY